MILFTEMLRSLLENYGTMQPGKLERIIVKLYGKDIELTADEELLYTMMVDDQKRIVIASEEKRISEQLKNRRNYLKRTHGKCSDSQITDMLMKEIESCKYSKDNFENEKYKAVLNGFQLLKTVYNGLQPIKTDENGVKRFQPVSTTLYTNLVKSSLVYPTPKENQTNKHKQLTGLNGLSSQQGLDRDPHDAASAPLWDDFICYCLSQMVAGDDEGLFRQAMEELFNRLTASKWKTKDKKPIADWHKFVDRCIRADRDEDKFRQEPSVEVEESFTEIDNGSSSTDNWA